MRSDTPPDAVAEAARARSRARLEHDWPEADRLKAEIEAAGWRVVDRGAEFDLRPAIPPDLVIDEVVWHGSSGSVPSRLGEDPSAAATVVVVPWGASAASCLETAGRVASFAPADATIVTVVTGPGPSAAGASAGSPGEVVRMRGPAGPGATGNAAIRRAPGAIVIVLAGGATPEGDILAPLVRSLADETVAIAGGWGSVTSDLRDRESIDAGEADLLAPWCLAFRRVDYVSRGPLDERFLTPDGLAAWWSLALRDEGVGPPRRALVVADLPLRMPPAPGTGEVRSSGDPADDRARRRDFYRLLDRYGRRPDLARGRRRRG